MASEGGAWIMRGLSWSDPLRIRTWRELTDWIEEIGFLPLFAGEVAGFSAEEHVGVDFWWTGDRNEDPWEWRELIAADHRVAYGKFFDGKAGFISQAYLPLFANSRRNGYDFDARWQDGQASQREKRIMELFMDVESDDEPVFYDQAMLSTQLKQAAGFGKGGEKNYPGVLTSLQAQLYLVISGFRRRENRRGEPYGMAVSVLQPPETLWGYAALSAAYDQEPADSWQILFDHVKALYPSAPDDAVRRLIGRRP